MEEPSAERESPDQRAGQWTPQEIAYASKIGELFRVGRIPNCPEGITLRALLANLLNCAPMRISKKYSGDKALGKRTYRRAEFVAQAQQIQDELRLLEQAFHTSVRGTGVLKMSLLGTSNLATPLSGQDHYAKPAPQQHMPYAYPYAVPYGDAATPYYYYPPYYPAAPDGRPPWPPPPQAFPPGAWGDYRFPTTQPIVTPTSGGQPIVSGAPRPARVDRPEKPSGGEEPPTRDERPEPQGPTQQPPTGAKVEAAI